MFRVHFTDDYGQGSFDVETREKAYQSKQNLNNDPNVWDVWVEDLDYKED